MTTLFVSDLHLHPARPEATDCFLRFLKDEAAGADRLYILGDLFEAWIGDDAPDSHDLTVMSALRTLTSAGIPVDFIRGNRDFLIGERFSAMTGVRLLADESVVTIGGRPVLLMHGDTLCTDDRAYQRYRAVVRQPLVERTFRTLPLTARRRIADWARSRSRAANATKPEIIMDVNPQAVQAALRRHDVDTLVHGHTHRPAVHHLQLDGRPAKRIVLGDWYEQGSVLRLSADAAPELTGLPWPSAAPP